MLKTHTEEVVEVKEIIDEVVCNCCGENIKRVASCKDIMYEYVTVQSNWGYFQNSFIDGEQHEIHLCEKCYCYLLSQLKIAPTGFGDVRYTEDDIEGVDEQLTFEEWKQKLENK